PVSNADRMSIIGRLGNPNCLGFVPDRLSEATETLDPILQHRAHGLNRADGSCGRRIMTKGQILRKYKDLSPEDQLTFDRWLRANALAGALLAMVVVTIPLNGSRPPSPSATPATRALTASFQHSLAHLDNLPVDHIENYALTFATR